MSFTSLELIDPKSDDYMRFGDGAGNKLFDCHWTAGSRSGSDPCTGVPHFWTLDQTYDGFYDDVSATLGIDKSWIAWGDRGKDYDCAANAEDGPMRPGGSGSAPPCRRIFRRRLNVPVKASDDDIVDSLFATWVTVGLDIYRDATVSMKEIKDIGERAKEEKKKRELILKILTFVFMALPFVGEALGPVVGSATALASIAILISEAGNAAVTIADIIKDPTSAPFAMLGLIVGATGGGKLSKTEGLQQASKARSLMKAADLAKFP
ncbi:hypothetical protein V8C34DRAFT_314937 [Trichoderma compactum]